MGTAGENTPEMNASSRILLGHPSGNQFFRHLARHWRESGRLAELFTSIDWNGPVWLERVMPRGLVQEMNRRNFTRSIGGPVTTHGEREILRLLASRLGIGALVRHETGIFSVDAVYRDFDRWVAARIARGAVRADAVYAYEDGAADTFAAAAARGWARVYDLPIAHWRTSRRLLEEEAQRWPEWAPTLLGPQDSAGKLARKDRELALATHVVCPSHFVAESLHGQVGSTQQVIVAPFGSPPVGPERSARARSGPLRVLFAGTMSQRKGLADLFAAMRELGRNADEIELIVMGSPVLPLEFYRGTGVRFTFEATRPHAAVLALMRTCDVLCLPSIVEGRALVVQEAMSQGLPAIVTANTGTSDVVEDGVSGFIVPIRAPAELARRLAWCAENRAALAEMGRAAQAASARFSWANYTAAISSALFPE